MAYLVRTLDPPVNAGTCYIVGSVLKIRLTTTQTDAKIAQLNNGKLYVSPSSTISLSSDFTKVGITSGDIIEYSLQNVVGVYPADFEFISLVLTAVVDKSAQTLLNASLAVPLPSGVSRNLVGYSGGNFVSSVGFGDYCHLYLNSPFYTSPVYVNITNNTAFFPVGLSGVSLGKVIANYNGIGKVFSIGTSTDFVDFQLTGSGGAETYHTEVKVNFVLDTGSSEVQFRLYNTTTSNSVVEGHTYSYAGEKQIITMFASMALSISDIVQLQVKTSNASQIGLLNVNINLKSEKVFVS